MDDLTAARERHVLYSITGHCRDCGFQWPCDAARFRDLADELAEKAALWHEVALDKDEHHCFGYCSTQAALAKWEANK